MGKKRTLSRRTFLRGSGVAIALPALDAMIPTMARAATGSPKRLVVIYLPNGSFFGEELDKSHAPRTVAERTAYRKRWPEDYFSSVFSPIADDILTFGGLSNEATRWDPATEIQKAHSRAIYGFSTGVNLYVPTTGKRQYFKGTSLDQIFAAHIFQDANLQVPWRSLPLGTNPDWRKYGGPNEKMSYVNGSQVPQMTDPVALYKDLFTSNAAPPRAGEPAIDIRKRSLLDFVLGDVKRLKSKLGPSDNLILDAHLASIESVERKLQSQTVVSACQTTRAPAAPVDTWKNMEVMFELLSVAFQCDLARIATLPLLSGEILNYQENMPVDGVTHPMHDLGHGRGGSWATRPAQMTKLHNRIYAQVVKFIESLKSQQDLNGSVLANSAVVFGGGMSTPYNHQKRGVPFLIAGQLGGAIRTGRRVDYGYTGREPNEDLAAVQLALLQKLGVPATRFGDYIGPAAEF